MNILIVGAGGREHALAWKAARENGVSHVYVAPGNAGTALEPKVSNINIDCMDIAGLIKFAKEHDIGLTIIGPEAPLVAGIVDDFTKAGLRCFGPSKTAAQLEGSKVFCKNFLSRHNIPTAQYGSFTDLSKAIDYINTIAPPLVVKADGLAAGKGVIIAATKEAAIDAARTMMADKRFGSAGKHVVIEEFLTGEEASFIAIVDGKNILPMATSQDHKPRDNGDTGPNTGGMGAYSPAPVVTPEIHSRIMKEIIEPTVTGMANEGNEYTGFLYAGVMIQPDGQIKVLEYNCRFGDPETQPIMMRLKSDLVLLCQLSIDKRLDEATIDWDPKFSLGVVLASGGYPDEYQTGAVISGLDSQLPGGTKIFHAGTATKNGDIVTTGGRVLCVCAMGDSVSDAQKLAYETTGHIHWTNMYFRTDIGFRAIAQV